jgi:hypothetical protein
VARAASTSSSRTVFVGVVGEAVGGAEEEHGGGDGGGEDHGVVAGAGEDGLGVVAGSLGGLVELEGEGAVHGDGFCSDWTVAWTVTPRRAPAASALVRRWATAAWRDSSLGWRTSSEVRTVPGTTLMAPGSVEMRPTVATSWV